MNRRRELFGRPPDDADARGEHTYPDDPQAVNRPRADVAEAALTRVAGQYVAGADGTQSITMPRAKP